VGRDVVGACRPEVGHAQNSSCAIQNGNFDFHTGFFVAVIHHAADDVNMVPLVSTLELIEREVRGVASCRFGLRGGRCRRRREAAPHQQPDDTNRWRSHGSIRRGRLCAAGVASIVATYIGWVRQGRHGLCSVGHLRRCDSAPCCDASRIPPKRGHEVLPIPAAVRPLTDFGRSSRVGRPSESCQRPDSAAGDSSSSLSFTQTQALSTAARMEFSALRQAASHRSHGPHRRLPGAILDRIGQAGAKLVQTLPRALDDLTGGQVGGPATAQGFVDQ
jgi:hypothetical protein